MSRHSKSYGRGKNQCGAGLQFDKLLKVCSNSKKASANKTAGALGRFGIASFTSTRNTGIGDSPGGGGGETESRFKSFSSKKRPKLSDPSSGGGLKTTTTATTTLNKDSFLLGSGYHNNNSNFMSGNPYSQISSIVQPPPIIKPRKFFKSRGPQDVGETLKPKPPAQIPPDIRTSLIAPIKIPIPKPNKSPKNKSTAHNSSEKNLKTLRNATNVSPPNSQPIKLRIFKDKTTSKFVSEAPPPVLDSVQLGIHHHHNNNTNTNNNNVKQPKKRGRKPKNYNPNLEGEPNTSNTNYMNTSTPPFHNIPPPPIITESVQKKPTGRATRNSRLGLNQQRKNQQQQQQETDPQQLQQQYHHHQLQQLQQPQLLPCAIQSRNRNSDSSLSAMPILSRAHSRDSEMEENISGSENNNNLTAYPPTIFHHSSSSTSSSNNNINSGSNNNASNNYNMHYNKMHSNSKLEDDAEFQQLCQTLSSMEEESDYTHHHHHPHHQQQQQQPPQQQQLHSTHSYNNNSQQMYSAHPHSSHHHHQFPNESTGIPATTTTHRNIPMNISNEMPMVSPTTIPTSINIPQITPPPPPPVIQKTRDSQDIRAILEDDWDESFDDEASPKKSPPKTSRFDLSAFMPDNSNSGSAASSSPINTTTNTTNTSSTSAFQLHQNQGVTQPMGYQQHHQHYPQQHHQYQQHQMNPPQNNPYLDTQQQQHHHQQLAPPFNAPYAVRNLLSHQSQGYPMSTTTTNTSETHTANTNYPHTSSDAMSSIPFINSQQQHNVMGGDSIASTSSSSFNIIEKSSSVALNLSASATLSGGGREASISATSSSIPHTSNSQNTNQTSSSSGGAKKGSIFKSRAMAQAPGEVGNDGSKGNPKKRLALYKHKFGGDLEEDRAQKMVQGTNHMGSNDGTNVFQDDFDDDSSDPEDLASMRRVNAAGSDAAGDASGSKVVCKKSSKKLFTVIRNVKPIHELQESGEFHEFDGDIWYILEDLKDKNPMTNRCLSAISLAMRCMEPAFRMHLRAHGTVAEFCKELHDAPNHPILALLASTVLFVLSQDRLNMDLDTDSLRLIIALTKAEDVDVVQDNESNEILKHRQRVINLVSEMKNRGHAEHLKLEKITASELALETLLYLTSKRAGEWVKHELRTLLGLDHIVTEVVTSLQWLREELSSVGWIEAVIERLWKIDRCLRVLQQVTFNHEENQRYLLGLSGSNGNTKVSNEEDQKLKDVPEIFITLFKFCNEQLSTLPKDVESATVIREILFSVLRVLVNLSHDYRGIVLGSEILCSLEGFLPLCLHSVFHLSSSIPDEKTFDLLMHSLCMLLNLVEHSKGNRLAILSSTIKRPRQQGQHSSWSSEGDANYMEQPTLDALVEMFLEREKAAKKEEASTDDILTKGSDSKSQGKQSNSQNSQNSQNSTESESTNSVQDTIDKLIQTAGKHMENSLIAAYISLLLAYLIMDDPISAETVRNSMPNYKYLPLMIVLKKLFNFMSITSSASGSLRGLKATAIALKFYAKCDPQSNEELKKIIPD